MFLLDGSNGLNKTGGCVSVSQVVCAKYKMLRVPLLVLKWFFGAE